MGDVKHEPVDVQPPVAVKSCVTDGTGVVGVREGTVDTVGAADVGAGLGGSVPRQISKPLYEPQESE